MTKENPPNPHAQLKPLKAKEIAGRIVEAEMRDDWAIADLLRPNLRKANKVRKADGLPAIRATQAEYFQDAKQTPSTLMPKLSPKRKKEHRQ